VQSIKTVGVLIGSLLVLALLLGQTIEASRPMPRNAAVFFDAEKKVYFAPACLPDSRLPRGAVLVSGAAVVDAILR
jgi:hypothetical protein